MEQELRLLGRALVLAGGHTVDLPDGQTTWLCAYLACREGWVGRDELLGLFWAEEDDRVARHNLSQLLYKCRTQDWASDLEVERTRLRLNANTDVKRFHEAVERGDWNEAVSYYRGDLLESSFVAGSGGAYQDWLQSEREALRLTWREAALAHAAVLEAQESPADAAALLHEVLRRETLAEDVLQSLMRCATAAGQRDLALKAYEEFRRRLADELGMEPLTATSRLAQGARSEPSYPARQAVRAGHSPTTEPAQGGLRNAPPQATPFIGRDLELAELGTLLDGSETRLITLLGPGGAGKTRLALQVARDLAGRYRDGAVLVPLAHLAEHDQVSGAVLEAIGAPQPRVEDHGAYLRELLAGAELLLVLDNFEHLLAGVGQVDGILTASPRSRILVTSREPLGLRSETIYDVGGLAYPVDDDHDELEEYEAVALFVRSARRSLAGFMLRSEQKQAVVQLCRLLRGQPLGLELAASWVRLLSPTEIVEEFSDAPDLLEANAKDLPARHRSLAALFDSSWRLLSDEERTALTRLSVFRNRFDKDLARKVTGVSLRALLNLVNKSLLQRSPQGGFEWHVSVQQFAAARLAASQAELVQARRDLLEWATSLVDAASQGLRGPDQEVWLEMLDSHHENLRGALNLALESNEPEVALHLAAQLWQYWYNRGHYAEGLRYLVWALSSPGAASLPHWRARAQSSAGILAHGQGRLAAAEEYFLGALETARRLGDARFLGDLLNNLGNIAQEAGNYAEAHRYHQESLALRRAQGDQFGTAVSLNNLGNVLVVEGKLESAASSYGESLELHRALGDAKGESFALTGLALVAFEDGRLDEAANRLDESIAIRRKLGFRWGVADALGTLGDVSLARGDAEGARNAHSESLAIKLDDGATDEEGIAASLEGLCGVAALEGRGFDALRLAAKAAALRDQAGAPLTRSSQTRLESRIDGAQAALSPSEVRRALSSGRIMSVYEAAALAAGPQGRGTKAQGGASVADPPLPDD